MYFVCRVDSLCLYTKDATYQRKCFGTSRFWTSLCVLWQDSQSFVLGRRGWGHWLSAGQKMNLCFDVGFSIAPPSLTGEVLSTWDTTKSLSDIFSVPLSRAGSARGPLTSGMKISYQLLAFVATQLLFHTSFTPVACNHHVCAATGWGTKEIQTSVKGSQLTATWEQSWTRWVPRVKLWYERTTLLSRPGHI